MKILFVIIGLAILGAGLFVAGRSTQPDTQQDISTAEPSQTGERDVPLVVTTEESVSHSFGETLDLSNEGLTKVPENTFKRIELESLDVSGNALTGALQAEVRHLRNLISLDLSDNDFTGVPAEIGQLERLEYLDLSNNPITGLPLELGSLSRLKELDLRGTNYSEYDLSIIKQKLPSDVVILVDSE
jgi:Leucine-rich repeat (LRR) protein